MRGYGQFCPVAAAAAIVAERWTPLVVRELLCGSRRFNDIHRGVPLMSRTLLATRLAELEEAGVIRREVGPGGRATYRLTEQGEALRPVIEALGEWGLRFAQPTVQEDDLDAALLMWDLRRKIRVQVSPPRRVVIHFELEGVPPRDRRRTRWWVIARPDDEVDLCLKDPGFEVDLAVVADLAALTRLWLWRLGWREAVRAGSVRVEGGRALVHALPSWLPVPLVTPAEPPRFVIAAAR